MDEAEQASRQRKQLDRYLSWVKEEGGIEGPTHLSTWFKPQQQERLRWLKERCTGTIMELGSNYGFLLAYCNGDIGVDWNEKSIALAKILNPSKEFIVADIRKLPFPNGYIDTVLLTDVLEHLLWEDVPKAIAEAKRIARKRLLITVPNGDHNTDEVTSMKHQWLADSLRQEAMMGFLIDKRRLGPTWRLTSGKTTEHFKMVMVEMRLW